MGQDLVIPVSDISRRSVLEAADPVSPPPALPWVVFCSPGKKGRLGSSHCPGGPLYLQERVLAVSAPLSCGCLGLSPSLFSGSVCVGTGRPRSSLTWAGMRLGSPAQRTSPELTQIRTQVEAGQRSPSPDPSGVVPCATAVLCLWWPRALGAAGPLPATQSILMPLDPAGRGQEGDGWRLGSGSGWRGCLRWPRGSGGPRASKAGGGEGGQGRSQSGGPGRTSPAALT